MKLVTLRTSERTKFKRCPLAWWWGYREGLKPQGPPDIKLWFGEGVHLALALWYKPGRQRGIDPRITWRKFVAEDIRFIKTEFSREYDPVEYVEAGDFGEELLGNYLDFWGSDRNWEILAPEQNFEVLIPGADGKPIARLVGTFDGVFRDLDDGRRPLPRLLEHKTAKAIYTGHLELDDQRGTYYAVADHVLREMGLIKPKEEIVEMIYNFLRKGHADDRPTNAEGQSLNKDGSVSKVQPSPLFVRHPVTLTRVERMQQLAKISNEVKAMNMFRTGELEIYKTPTRDCSWDCDFYEMCVLDESNPDDVPEFKHAAYRVQDPYAAHRKSAAA